ncbi:hypothetical protein PaG_00098 [Moesziomyces aphidis]|jgi:alkylhydroperoxidase/carboxymuconolactone decarboxylase family protein YurZ|uniref:Carboxymuconolactone decarboxylase-like domain-containing protein n=1 Tax=Moesziomyces aphidis TaxID=84754 RepID=W3VV46_MOEAP|nr:hypothetical protein PaG_00098 [Moesziomyces aphidis]
MSSWSYPAVAVPAVVTRAEILAWRDALSAPVRERSWLLVLTSALVSSHHGPETVRTLYELALSESAADKAAAQSIQRRIQETLVKGSVIFGIPPALDTVFELLAHIRSSAPSHLLTKDDFTRSHLLDQPVSSLGAKAEEALRRVYRHNLDEILDVKMNDNMQDLKFLTLDVNYGLNLAQQGVVDWRDTELVVLAALVTQNCRAEVLWHMRGAMRAGWSEQDVQSVRKVAIDIATRLGMRTDKVPALEMVSEDSND